jgi:hypothetical protein
VEALDYLGLAVLLSIAVIWEMHYLLIEKGPSQGYTELYFQRPFEKITKEELDDPIIFTIHNNESEHINYNYRVTAEYGDSNRSYMRITSGNVSVRPAESVNISFTIPKNIYKIIYPQNPEIRVSLLKTGSEEVYREIRRCII